MSDTMDSRKRPLDTGMGHEGGASKRSNTGLDINLKLLVPRVVAGSIIGKGGENIVQLQKDAGAKVKMSKANDFYPGTTERVCLINGTSESVMFVFNFIIDKIDEKPASEKGQWENSEGPLSLKVLVPNSTAGMIIGKAGGNIKAIKEETGSFLQISQKSDFINLPERCVAVTGEKSQIIGAVAMLVEKISEDPASGSCLNLSYADHMGPVASANPSGSTYLPPRGGVGNRQGGSYVGGFRSNGIQNGGFSNNSSTTGIGLSMQALHLNSPLVSGLTGAMMDAIRAVVRQSGYNDGAVEEIVGALSTLANYNMITLGFNSQGVNISFCGGLGGGSTSKSNGLFPASGQNGGFGNGVGGTSSFQGNSSFLDSSEVNVYGPLGTTTTTMAMAMDQLNSSTPNFGFGSKYRRGGNNQNVPQGGSNMDEKRELDIPESVVGVILGRAGQDIVSLQQQTGTRIQISKKGVYAPGTQNRIVVITGPSSSVNHAEMVIRNKINSEESRRQTHVKNVA